MADWSFQELFFIEQLSMAFRINMDACSTALAR
jgi:hypothetical protein